MNREETSILLLLIAFAMAFACPARASDDAPLTQCDTYAASPFDPNRKTNGVQLEELDPSFAVPACENAVRAFPYSARLISQLARAYYKKGDLKAALVQNRKAAVLGNVLAQYNLASALDRGEGTSVNFSEAIKWYQAAAAQGYPAAQSNLGGMYIRGQGVDQDYAEAGRWYRRAADQGFARAEAAIGAMYVLGQGVAVDYDEAEKWFRMAAAKGDIPAKQSLEALASQRQSAPAKVAEASTPNTSTTTAREQDRSADLSGGTIFIGLVILAIVFYLLPTFVAQSRRHNNAGAILALNLLLGWTFLGWVMALVWALTDNTQAKAT